MSRFFVEPQQVGLNTITIEDAGDLRHMRKVLRLQPGDEVDISDGQMWEYRTRIDVLDADSAQLTILDKQSFAAEPSVEITLYQGIPKQGKMETIIQKCVELGVYRIVPVFMDRTVVVDKGNFGKKVERWQKVSAEAVKQCRRGIIPEVTQAQRMSQVLAELAPADDTTPGMGATPGCYDLVLIPYENEQGTTLKDVLREAGASSAQAVSGAPSGASSAIEASGPRRIAVLIGPEGGFSEAEVAAVTAAGGKSVTLGKTTLRTETAGMAAIAMIMYELEL